MNIDNKFPLFRGHLSDFRLSSKQSKTTMGQTMVLSTEQKSVGLELKSGEKSHDKIAPPKKISQDKNEEDSRPKQNTGTKQNKDESETKFNLKLLNLI